MTRDTARRKTVGIGPACPYETERSDDRPPRPTLCQIGSLEGARRGRAGGLRGQRSPHPASWGESPFRARRGSLRHRADTPPARLSHTEGGTSAVCVQEDFTPTRHRALLWMGSVCVRALGRRVPFFRGRGSPPTRSSRTSATTPTSTAGSGSRAQRHRGLLSVVQRQREPLDGRPAQRSVLVPPRRRDASREDAPACGRLRASEDAGCLLQRQPVDGVTTGDETRSPDHRPRWRQRSVIGQVVVYRSNSITRSDLPPLSSNTFS